MSVLTKSPPVDQAFTELSLAYEPVTIVCPFGAMAMQVTVSLCASKDPRALPSAVFHSRTLRSGAVVTSVVSSPLKRRPASAAWLALGMAASRLPLVMS